MATLKDIAKALELGVSTVSMALNGNKRIGEETRTLVVSKAIELGYVKNGIAVDLQRKRTNLILLILTDASRSHFSNLIRTVQLEVAKQGYDLLIVPTINSASTAMRYISEHRADGAIVYTNQIEDDFLKIYARENYPIFLIGKYIKHPHIYCPGKERDWTVGTALGVDYLLSKGHKRIAFVKGSMNTRGTPRRFKAYKRTLQENNIEYDANLIFDAADSNYEAGYKVSEELAESIKNIDAIYCSNDDIAIGILRGLADKGIDVPNDVSLIGNNNLPESSIVTPRLTTVDDRQDLTSALAVKTLINAIENGPINREDLEKSKITGSVIERETVIPRR